MPVGRRRKLLAVLTLCAGCASGPAEGPVGRWERPEQPADWVEFHHDGTFRAHSYLEEGVFGGPYELRGDTVVVTSQYGHTGRLTVRGEWLVHEDGTRMRRAGKD